MKTGGTVIGKTNSGKSVYSGAKANIEKNYTAQDHKDAAYINLDKATELTKKGLRESAEFYNSEFDRHIKTSKHKGADKMETGGGIGNLGEGYERVQKTIDNLDKKKNHILSLVELAKQKIPHYIDIVKQVYATKKSNEVKVVKAYYNDVFSDKLGNLQITLEVIGGTKLDKYDKKNSWESYYKASQKIGDALAEKGVPVAFSSLSDGEVQIVIIKPDEDMPDDGKMAKGGGVEGGLSDKINHLYEKSGFINSDFNWKLKLLEMLQGNSIDAYNIYQTLTKKQKEDVLQEQFELDNDMGSDGDGDIETTKENLNILLQDAKNGKKYAKGGGPGDNQLNVVFSRKDVFEKAKDFYENESAFYPADVNDEFRTFVFDIENGEADVTEYYLNEELQGTELDGYYFEIADKMETGGGISRYEPFWNDLKVIDERTGAIWNEKYKNEGDADSFQHYWNLAKEQAIKELKKEDKLFNKMETGGGVGNITDWSYEIGGL